MKVVLFATRPAGALAPISEFSCLALLSVACKPLIVHTIEALAVAGLTDVIVAVSPDAKAVEAALGDGARWGMQFEYVHAATGESDEDLVERIRHRLGEEYLLVQGEILRTPMVADFLERGRTAEAQSVTATIGGVEAGVTLVKRGIGLKKNASAATTGLALGDGLGCHVEFPEARLSLLDSHAAFHRAHLDILAGHFGGLIIPGRETSPGVKLGCHSTLPSDAIKAVPVLIGSRCRIANNADLSGNVVVSDDVVIDSRAVLQSTVIMPHTYVGELVELDHAIVAGNRLIHVDTGVVAIVTDSFLLTTIHPENIAVQFRNLADRVIAAILLVATIWLWPIGLIAAVAENPRRPVRSRLLLGNRKQEKSVEFRALEFEVSITALRYLPYLLPVVAGHLRLIGESPFESGRFAPSEEKFEMIRDRGFAGLSGLIRSKSNAQVVTQHPKPPPASLRRPLAE
jgi:mannose-1-phosphate guanylyltransferase / phosphomannomutase